jgi:hypothetical protein
MLLFNKLILLLEFARDSILAKGRPIIVKDGLIGVLNKGIKARQRSVTIIARSLAPYDS